MRRFVLLLPLLALILSSLTPAAPLQTLTGAWYREADGNNEVVLVQDNYIVHTVFDKEGRKFHYTVGGALSDKGGGAYEVQLEFHSGDSTYVGRRMELKMVVTGNELSTAIESGETATWKRYEGGGGALTGVWRISGRMQEGKVVPVQQSGPRKTLKVLTGGRFQWIAINPEVKGFYGTGGGTYTFENGSYTEHIEFFSRDNSRVGASLKFNGKLEAGAWHHSGNSSSGQPIYEVWSRVR